MSRAQQLVERMRGVAFGGLVLMVGCAAFGSVLGGCSLYRAEEPAPDAPVVAIAPLLISGQDVSPLLELQLDRSPDPLLRDRGYNTLPTLITRQVLGKLAVDDRRLRSDDWVGGLERYDVRYLLRREVASPGLSPDFQLRWTLVDVRTGESVWSRELSGGPGRLTRQVVTTRSGLEDDGLLSDERVFGRGREPRVQQIRTVTPEEQARDVQQRIAALMPRAESLAAR